MKTQFAEKGTPESESLAGGIHQFPSAQAQTKTILLLSNDNRLHENLRSLANVIGLFVIKAEHASGIVAILQATRPVAVVLDLDLPDEAAWETGDLLLNEPDCPAVILISGRTPQFDMRTAIRAGSLVSKEESPDHLLEIIQERLELPETNRAERNAIQRVLIRWLRPSGWVESSAPAHHFWHLSD